MNLDIALIIALMGKDEVGDNQMTKDVCLAMIAFTIKRKHFGAAVETKFENFKVSNWKLLH